MKILSLRVQDGFYWGFHEFSNLTVVYSQKNSAGKTTLLRSILYALGYSIPGTKGLNFETIQFEIRVQLDDGQIVELRRRNVYLQLRVGGDEEYYSLPSDETKLHKRVFCLSNGNRFITENLLGAFYFDQENGWTMFNRGNVIGGINFSIEDLFCGLAENPCVKEREQLKIVEREIRKCNQMISIADYKGRNVDEKDFVEKESPADERRAEIELLRSKRKSLANEFFRIKKSCTSYNDFSQFIASIGLTIKTKAGEEILVTPERIVGFAEHGDLLRARLNEARFQVAEIDNQIARLEESFRGEDLLFEVETAMERFDKQIAHINIDKKMVQSRLNALRKERVYLHEKIQTKLSMEGALIVRFRGLVNGYLAEMGLGTDIDIFARSRKELSGAVLHLVVFAFKAAYVKLIFERTGCHLPLIIDSPNGREIVKNHIQKTYDILVRDFADHQIIMATIFNPNLPGQDLWELDNGVMPNLIGDE